ncbi:MAG: chromosome segregation protein SMC [Clostridiales bacterium]|nr:chromosome segregation protein SMC [Clostridiales bacterium]
MYFKRVDIHGFKSFAEPVSIEFHDGITCIVGPNGSGKSNISDAIRWVLGEQSPKMLRGGKMEEVIFSGTANRKSRGMAEVTLVIDNTKNILPIDYSEVAITRRMYRSGESEYLINKVPCRLKDIRELIMDTGIGVEGYSIIGQGKIADIVSNKPESRRQIFEEAAGIVKYRSKKAESERKLESSKANLDRVNDIIGEIESRIDSLREESEKAKEYLELRERYKKVEVNIILKNVESLELKNEYIKDDLLELSGYIDTYKQEKDNIDKQITEKRARIEELDRLSNEARDKLMSCNDTISTLKGENELRKEKLSTLVKEQERLSNELSLLAQKKQKEGQNANELRNSKGEIEKELNSLTQKLEEKNKELDSVNEVVQDVFKIIEDNKNRVYEQHSFIAGKKSEINSLNSLKDTLEKRKGSILEEKELSATEEVSLRDKYQKALNDKELIETKLKNIVRNKQEESAKYNEYLSRQNAFIKELEETKIAIGQAYARQKTIEEMETSYEGYNQAVQFLMKKNIPGLHGVVADLIQVPLGYETAIETALGPALQNIVCNDEKNAQDAIELLKQNKAGRLTFLPLSRIKPYMSNISDSISEMPGFIGLATDCIKFDNKYSNIMGYLLGRVVIVDKLSNAVALSKNASGVFRFVTLDGEIINSGGAITGGAYRNKTSGLLERKSKARRLEYEIQKLKQSQNNISKDLEYISVKLTEIKERIESLDREYRDSEIELFNCENVLKGLSAGMTELEEAKSKWDKEIANIDKEGISADDMIEKLQLAVEEAELKIKESEDVIKESIKEHEELIAKQEALKEEITQIRIQVNSTKNNKDNIEQTLRMIESYISEYEKDIKIRHEQLESLKSQELDLRQSEGGFSERLEELEKQKSEAEALLAGTQEEKSSISSFLEEIQSKKESVENMLLNYQSSKHELELKLAKNETQVDSYKEKLWEDFEISYLQAMEFKDNKLSMSSMTRESREIRARIKELGDVNVGAIKEYESVKERYDFLSEQREDLLEAIDSLVKIIDDMDSIIKRNFKDSFDKIMINFEEAFRALFGGGSAELRLEDPTNPLETGIEIVAQPPGKKLQNINLMSGGEKTLTAIALMFAILKAKPTPFCILDEVEASLDDANIDRFVRYLKSFKDIQFALVTHQKATMEYADVLYGVTMPEQGVSKVISLKLGDEFDL